MTEILRRHGLAARSLTVFIETNRFSPNDFYSNSSTFKSAYPADSLFELQTWPTGSLQKIFREHHEYKNAA